MDKLQNCPSCGGTLDDNGRCLYCKSKVYDLTDINIDLNSRDALLLKLKSGDNATIMKCYPIGISIDCQPDYMDCTTLGGEACYVRVRNTMEIHLDLMSYDVI